jgi:hypothetical protein
VADGLGSYSVRTNTYMNGSAPLKISDDGRRVAYYRPADEHFVVRDLLSGHLTVIDRRVPLASLYRGGATLMLSGNGQRLAISFNTDAPVPALLADTTTGTVHTLPGSWVIGLGKDASTVTLAETKGTHTTLLLAGPDGTLRGRVQLSPDVQLLGQGNLVAPDGHTLLTLPSSHRDGSAIDPATWLDTVTLVDVRTGKVVGTHHFQLPKNIEQGGDVAGWTDNSTIVVSSMWPALPERTEGGLFLLGEQRYLVDLNTGRTRIFGTIKLQAAQGDTAFGALMP